MGIRGAGRAGALGGAAEAYSACTGEQHSPVDITGYEEGDGGPLSFSYASDASAVRNDHKFVYVDFAAGSTLRAGQRTFGLNSAHLHAPSEHRVDGVEFAAELHLVHADSAGETLSEGILLSASACVPDGSAYYSYDGSKTTPPCQESVGWFVMREPRTISQEQVAALLALSGGPNNRPVQPIGGRAIRLGGAS